MIFLSLVDLRIVQQASKQIWIYKSISDDKILSSLIRKTCHKCTFMVIFTREIFNGKLHFLCSLMTCKVPKTYCSTNNIRISYVVLLRILLLWKSCLVINFFKHIKINNYPLKLTYPNFFQFPSFFADFYDTCVFPNY